MWEIIYYISKNYKIKFQSYIGLLYMKDIIIIIIIIKLI